MTRRVVLIGKPLRRRHSAVLHDAAFVKYAIDARYELRELQPDDLTSFVPETRSDDWLGFQVTAPYKRAIMPLLDEVKSDARAIGAVNSVARLDDGSLVGFNTDAPGFVAAADRELDLKFTGASVVVAGAGGAAHAVAYACAHAGAAEVLVVSRRPDQAIELARRLGSPVRSAALPDRWLTGALQRADLVVNATTVGMLSTGTALDPDALGAHTTVFDLVYVPAETEFVRRSRERGLRAAGGAEMLVAQAAIAFRRWTGVQDASAVMREALAPLLAEATAP